MDYDPVHKKRSWRKLKLDPEAALQTSFYDKLPVRDIADIFRFVNGQCNFLSALTPRNRATPRKSPIKTVGWR
jgi:hypothetical protein